jgi:SAM-dependent methyltransferase
MIQMSETIRKRIPGFLDLPGSGRIRDIDNASTVAEHRKIINSNRFLKKLYIDFYKYFSRSCAGVPDGLKVEIGSGAGFLKEFIHNVITSDVVECGNDTVFRAEKMPCDDSSVSMFFMLDVLHHIPDPEAFFREANRCLKSEGKIVMIEPGNSVIRRVVCRKFHHEPFMTRAREWRLPDTGRLSASNQAIPWMMFIRDRNIFEKKFPGLRIVRIKNHTPFRYFLSGGLSMRQLMPSFTYDTIKLIECVLQPVSSVLGSSMSIELVKEDSG